MTQHTPLFQEHQSLHARMVEYAGWAMPVQYESIPKEHHSVRESAGIFDVSHMGRFFLSGPGASQGFSRLIASRIEDMVPGQVRYTVVCNPEGGIKDDILVTYLKPDVFFVVVNASNREKLLSWFRDNLRGKDIIHDRTCETGMIAIQGPESEKISRDIFSMELSQLDYYHAREIEEGIIFSRTGYTGENGFEVIAPNDRIVAFWKRACELGASPCGLGARDILRLEMGYPLYGHELSETISPLEAGLKRVVHFDKNDFIGKKALQSELERGVKRRRIGFQLTERGIPREHCRLFDGEIEIGESTSGGYSPLLKLGIGLALVKNDWQPGGALTIEIRGKKTPIEIKKPPFVPKRVNE